MKKALAAGLAAALLGALLWAWVRMESLDEDLNEERSENSALSNRLGILEAWLPFLEEELPKRLTYLSRTLRETDRRVEKVKEGTECFDNAAGLGGGSARGPLKGDIDGDGIRDETYAAGRPGTLGCRYEIAVVTERGLLRARVPYWGLGIGEHDLAYHFSPYALASINSVPGPEIIMTIHSGASTPSVGVFTLMDGRLVRMTGTYNNEFSYAGSAGYGSGVDCVSEGLIVSTFRQVKKVAKGKYRNEVDRDFYRVEGSRFFLQRTEHHEGISERELRAFPELSEYAFANCSGRTPDL